jgi:hypothetical protein
MHPSPDCLAHQTGTYLLRDGDKGDFVRVSSSALARSGDPAAYCIDILGYHQAMELEIYLILEQESMVTGEASQSLLDFDFNFSLYFNGCAVARSARTQSSNGHGYVRF